MSLRARLTLTYSIVVAVLIAGLGVVLYVAMGRALETEMDRRLLVRASQVELTIWPDTRTLKPEDLTSARLDLSPRAELDAPGTYVQVLDRAGGVVGVSENLRGATLPVESTDVASALAGRRVLSDVTVDEDTVVRVLSMPVSVSGRIVGVLQVGQSRKPLRATMTDLGTLLLLLGTAGLAVSGLVGWFIAYRGLSPLEAISRRAATIALKRDFTQRLKMPPARDEVGQLAVTIDVLLETVEETLRKHREFVADTSHELRNPLLALRTNLELLDRVPDDAGRAECVAEARQQIERMSRLVSDLLLLARFEEGQVIEQRPVLLHTIADRVQCEAQKRAKGRLIRLESMDEVQVSSWRKPGSRTAWTSSSA